MITLTCLKISTVCSASFTKSLWKTDWAEMSDKDLYLYNSNDDYDWGELKIWIPELEGIKICHAVNEIRVYHANGYSVPDLLRMNNFWCEVKATCAQERLSRTAAKVRSVRFSC